MGLFNRIKGVYSDQKYFGKWKDYLDKKADARAGNRDDLKALADAALDALIQDFPSPKDETPYRVKRLLLGKEFYDLAKKCFVKNEISPEEFRRSIREGLSPDFSYGADTKQGESDYLRLLEKGLVFNQIAYRIERGFPDFSRQEGNLCPYGKANLAAMALMNGLDAQVDEMLATQGPFHIKDAEGPKKMARFGEKAIRIADEIYDSGSIREIIEQIEERSSGGKTPLGAEAEFSNLGKEADDISNFDYSLDRFSNFTHARDFNVLSTFWRLGAYLDNDTQQDYFQDATRGFFEIAYGKNGSFSKPLTRNPWFLSEMLKHSTRFFKEIKPHSLHVNIEEQVTGNRGIGFDDLICLLYLGGDLGLDEQGVLREKRLYNDEVKLIERIGTDLYHCSEIPRGIIRHKERKNGISETGSYWDEVRRPVVEYQFCRLKDPSKETVDYEPLIMALKGFQFSYDPNSRKGKIEDEIKLLSDWASHPVPISEASIGNFTDAIEGGLISESGHSKEQIESAVYRIHEELRGKNNLVRAAGT